MNSYSRCKTSSRCNTTQLAHSTLPSVCRHSKLLSAHTRRPHKLASVSVHAAAKASAHEALLDFPEVKEFRRPLDVHQVTAPAGAPPFVFLPGFGNCTKDYTAPFGDADTAICANLQRRGFHTFVPQVTRSDWMRVARGILSPQFWRAQLTTHPGYSWYLERVHATVTEALEATGASQVTLVGHSAGGWLARAFLGDPQWFVGHVEGKKAKAGEVSAVPNPAVAALVTLGAPQLPAMSGSNWDRTGGAQTWVHASFPGARYAKQGVAYVTVCGSTVEGRRRQKDTKEPRTPASYAHDAYKEVCGRGQGVLGDGIVPVESAMLEGAEHVVLDGVYHSVSRAGTFDEPSGKVWYGSEEVVDLWLQPYLTQCAKAGRLNAAPETAMAH